MRHRVPRRRLIPLAILAIGISVEPGIALWTAATGPFSPVEARG